MCNFASYTDKDNSFLNQFRLASMRCLVIAVFAHLSILYQSGVLYSKTVGATEIGEFHPVIIWWTGRLYPHFNESKKLIQCAKGVCATTTDRQKKRSAVRKGFIMYGTDLEVEDFPLPRHPDDAWALLHEESPMNNYLFSHTVGITLFNYTATFSRHSDFPLTTQFIPGENYFLREPVPLSEKNEWRRRGLAPVLYVQSHCFVASDRDRYVKDLMKYVNIDSYGVCLHNKDLSIRLRSTETYNSEEFLEFIGRYKFHLAFENAVCDDYMTEKLFRALHVGSVPIYMGSKKVNDWMPNKYAVILTSNFESPSHLAEYILQLDTNIAEYNKYLQFKMEGVTNDFLKEQLSKRSWGVDDPTKIDFIQGFECFLCDKLYERNATALHIADKSHMDCPQPHIALGLDTDVPKNDEWFHQAWIDSYWYSYDLGRALHEMISRGENDSSRIHSYAMKLRYQH